VAVIAVPSFGGRVPEPAVKRLEEIRGNEALCTAVCVYGNRAYEDTLIELSDAARKSGFRVIAGIAAVAAVAAQAIKKACSQRKEDELFC